MIDYIDEYGDELEDIKFRLEHSLELVTEARKYLGQTLPRKALAELYEARKLAYQAESNIRSLYRSLDWSINQ